MTLTDLLSPEIPVVNLSDKVRAVLDIMEDGKYAFLPVVDNQRLVALLDEQSLYDADDYTAIASFVRDDADIPSLFADASVLDALGVMSKSRLDVLPVVDRNNKYLGSIGLSSMLKAMADMTGAMNVGKSIVVTVPLLDYCLSRIVNVVEDCGVKIVSILTSVSQTNVDILLKLSSDDTEAVVRSLERYGYDVLSYGNMNDGSDDVLRRNYDCLMKYLELVNN